MSHILWYVLASVGAVSAVSLIGALTLSLQERVLRSILFLLVSLSAGALFGDVFIHLIPETFTNAPSALQASLLILFGVLAFFILEKFLYWRHCHTETADEEAAKVKPVGFVVLVGDGVHNFIDGIIIGASYIAGVEAGLATTVAVMLHEIPQEIGDFGVLVHSGFTKTRALLYNFLSAISAFAGALLVLSVEGVGGHLAEFIVPVAAGSFLYIASSDLVPELHKTSEIKKSAAQLATVLFGIGVMYILLFIE